MEYDLGATRRRRPAPGSLKGTIAKYGVFGPGWEQLTRDIYDYQTYAQAGQTILNFFQLPVGQNSKTLADTNLTSQGSFPANQMFLAQRIEVDFIPGNVASATGAIVAANTNDVKLVGESGFLQFSIGTKEYYTGAPLKRFPTNNGIGGLVALSDTTTAAAARVTKIDAPYIVGHPCGIKPVMIPSNETFGVTLNWPTAVAVSVAGRIGVRLGGVWFRRSQ